MKIKLMVFLKKFSCRAIWPFWWCYLRPKIAVLIALDPL